MEQSGRIRSPDYNAAVILGVVLVIAAGLRTLCFSGLVGSADLAYLEEARNVANGSPLAEAHPFLNKPGFIYVEALTFRLFSTNETAQLTYPFLASLAGVALAFTVARRLWGTWAGTAAGIAVAAVPLDITAATRVYPDGPAAVFFALAVSAAFISGRSRPRVGWALLAGAAAGAAYLHTNSAVIALPVITIALLLGGSRKTVLLTRLLVASAAFIAVAGLELWRNAAVAGDSLLAWRAAFAGGRGPLAGDVLLRRLTADYANVLFWDAYGLGTIVALGAAGAITVAVSADRATKLTVFWFGVIFVALNFWPESLGPYVPVSYAEARYFFPLAFPAALLVGRTFIFLLENAGSVNRVGRWAGVLVSVFFAALLVADGSRRYFWIVFGSYSAPLVALISLIGWFRRRRSATAAGNAVYAGAAAAFLLVVSAAALGIALRFYAGPGSGNERWALELVETEGIKELYTDPRSARVISYLNGYSKDLNVIEFTQKRPGEDDFVFVNRARFGRLRAAGYRIPRYARRPPATWAEVARVEGRAPAPAVLYRARW